MYVGFVVRIIEVLNNVHISEYSSGVFSSISFKGSGFFQRRTTKSQT